MNERLTLNDPEQGSHWCPTYEDMERRVADLLAELGGGTAGVEERGPKIMGVPLTPDLIGRVPLELAGIEVAMRSHIPSCGACVQHFSQQDN